MGCPCSTLKSRSLTLAKFFCRHANSYLRERGCVLPGESWLNSAIICSRGGRKTAWSTCLSHTSFLISRTGLPLISASLLDWGFPLFATKLPSQVGKNCPIFPDHTSFEKGLPPAHHQSPPWGLFSAHYLKSEWPLSPPALHHRSLRWPWKWNQLLYPTLGGHPGAGPGFCHTLRNAPCLHKLGHGIWVMRECQFFCL